jgi:hypothetical protein
MWATTGRINQGFPEQVETIKMFDIVYRVSVPVRGMLPTRPMLCAVVRGPTPRRARLEFAKLGNKCGLTSKHYVNEYLIREDAALFSACSIPRAFDTGAGASKVSLIPAPLTHAHASQFRTRQCCRYLQFGYLSCCS